VVPFQAACGDDPEELFGIQRFRLSVDSEGQTAIFFADAEWKDPLQVEEAADDIFPRFVVNRFDVTPVVLRFFNGSDHKTGFLPQRRSHLRVNEMESSIDNAINGIYSQGSAHSIHIL
jgi:hypothetical protein